MKKLSILCAIAFMLLSYAQVAKSEKKQEVVIQSVKEDLKPVDEINHFILAEDNIVEFKAVGNPGFIRINGKGGKVEGSLKEKNGVLNGELFVKMEAFDTDMSLRNKHMREKYLEVDKHPFAKLYVKDVKVSDNMEFKADLEIKGDKKPVTIKAKKTGKNISANFELDIKDYPSIGVPSWVGVTIAEKIEVLVLFKVK